MDPRLRTVPLYLALCLPAYGQEPMNSHASLHANRPAPVCVERKNPEGGIERICRGYERRIDVSSPVGALLKRILRGTPRTAEVYVQGYTEGPWRVAKAGLEITWGAPYTPKR